MRAFLYFFIILFLILISSSLLNDANSQSPYSVTKTVGAGGQVGITNTPTPTPTLTPTLTPTPTPTSAPSQGGISPTPTVIPTPTQVPLEIVYEDFPDYSVGAIVGDYYLGVSGFSSPKSFVSLIIDNVELRSSVVNDRGSFSISRVLIKKGFSKFCLKAIDNKNISSSLTCFTIPPANKSLQISNIFLPPSIGLEKQNIRFFEDAVIFGFTMPESNVTIYINNNQKQTIKADKNGYFRYTIRLSPGKYTVYATAKYKTIVSRAPSNSLNLIVVDFWGMLWQFLIGIPGAIYSFILSIPNVFYLLILLLIGFISALALKLWGSKYRFNLSTLFMWPIFLFGKKKLHHYWWMGY